LVLGSDLDLDLEPQGHGTPLGPWYISVTNPKVHLVSKFSTHSLHKYTNPKGTSTTSKYTSATLQST